METLTQFLIDWGYWGLFFSALIAGSIVPFSSEAVMLVLVHMGLDPVLCVVSAASGKGDKAAEKQPDTTESGKDSASNA